MELDSFLILKELDVGFVENTEGLPKGVVV